MTTVVAVVEQSTLVRPGTLSLFSRVKILLLVITAAAPLHGHGPEGPRDDPHTSENTVSTEDNPSVCLLNTLAVELPVMIV